jgi:micrococcal nuclease
MARRRIPRTFDPPHRALRRRRGFRRGLFVGLLLLIASAALDRAGVFRYRGDDWRNFDTRTYVVTHVADGDTIVVRPPAGGAETRVRLLGIDAPEMKSAAGSGSDHWAHEARHAAAAVKGKHVTLKLDQTQTRDRYQRLLAYVYLDDSRNLNLELVRQGHAYADRRFPHGLRHSFEQAESEARRRERGLWKDVNVERMPPWRRQWLTTRGER